MREIKFRAWDKENGMQYIDDLYWFEEEGIHEVVDGKPDSAYYDYTITQYTGLKDRTGREIYEGDIVRFNLNFHNTQPENNKWVSFPVVYESGCFIVGGLNVVAARHYGGEVIGNIYENPEGK